MFTGIIEEVGQLEALTPSGSGLRLEIQAHDLAPTLRLGDSIAVNGVCMTAERERAHTIEVTAGPETLERTTIRDLKRGAAVNLERAMAANGRFGGHFVQGHVDGTTEVKRTETNGEFVRITFSMPSRGAKIVVEKGSVAINGVSLTVSRLGSDEFSVDLVPFTLEKTNLKVLKPGDRVNIEFDMIAKVVERVLQGSPKGQGITWSLLKEHGFSATEPDMPE
ncbi:riboflavin synthase [Acidobacteriota bacterium]